MPFFGFSNLSPTSGGMKPSVATMVGGIIVCWQIRLGYRKSRLRHPPRSAIADFSKRKSLRPTSMASMYVCRREKIGLTKLGRLKDEFSYMVTLWRSGQERKRDTWWGHSSCVISPAVKPQVQPFRHVCITWGMQKWQLRDWRKPVSAARRVHLLMNFFEQRCPGTRFNVHIIKHPVVHTN
jgi:hypothetical protein